MLRKKIYLQIILIFFTFKGFAQDTLSLSRAVRASLANNYDIIISGYDQKIAQNNNSWGNAGRYPSVVFNAAQTNSWANINTPGSFLAGQIERHGVAGNIDLAWVLFDGFKVNINKRRFEKLEQLSNGNAAVIVEGTVQSVVLGYYQVLLERERLNVYEKILKLSQDKYELAKLKKDIGTASEFDLLQARNDYLSDSTNYLYSRLNFQNAVRNLNLLMAVDSEKNYSFNDQLNFSGIDFVRDTLYAKMISNNQTLRNQYINQAILRENVKFQRSNLFPRISINTGMNAGLTYLDREGQPVRTGDSYDFYANLSLSYTLFNGGRIKRGIENAELEAEMDSVGIQQQIFLMKNQLASFYDLYNIRRNIFALSEENLKTAEAELSLAETKYRTGNFSAFDYRQVQLSYLNVALQRYQLIYDLIDVHTSLARITGGILDMR